jgi:hypothetical protein
MKRIYLAVTAEVWRPPKTGFNSVLCHFEQFFKKSPKDRQHCQPSGESWPPRTS